MFHKVPAVMLDATRPPRLRVFFPRQGALRPNPPEPAAIFKPPCRKEPGPCLWRKKPYC